MGDLKEVAPSGVIPNLEVDAIDKVLFDQDHKVDENLVLQILTNASIFNFVNISQDQDIGLNYLCFIKSNC